VSRPVLCALACALALALAGCASVSDNAQRRSLAALRTPDPKPLPGLPELRGTAQCERDQFASLAPGRLPAAGHMPSGSFMRQIQRRGYLIVGVDQNSLGLGYFDPATGRMQGFDIDVARAVARAIFGSGRDRYIRFRAISTQQREAAVYYGNVDMLASAFSINCKRKRRILFSAVYHRARQRLLVPVDSAVDSLSALRGKAVCATSASTTVENLKGTGVKPYRVELRPDCLVALQERDVAAVTADDTILLGLCEQDPQTKIVGPTINVERYGLAVDRHRPGFVRFINAVLKRLDLARLSRRWFSGLSAASNDEIRRCRRPAR
jgi:polar amino acid transport system substrate-binding protein